MPVRDPNRPLRDTARAIFDHALAEASIPKAFARQFSCERGILRVCDDLYDLNAYARVLVISIGKAGHTLVEALEAQVGSRLEGIVATSVDPASQVAASVISKAAIPRRTPTR